MLYSIHADITWLAEDMPNMQSPRVVVFAPAPLLTVTIEGAGGGEADVHLHGGGQGFWMARMIAALGMPVTLCGSFGGEIGAVVRGLIEREGVTARGVDVNGSNAVYIHDRRSGERVPLVETPPAPLTRHDADDLYAVTLVESIGAAVCVLSGVDPPEIIPVDVYRRLAGDLSQTGTMVVADLSGPQLESAVAGGVALLKVSHNELLADGLVAEDEPEQIVAAIGALRAAGAQRVVVSRGSRPALASENADSVVEVMPPRFEAVDERGTGDSMTAALAVSLARDLPWGDALRLGAAAGALNATRRGLGTGQRTEIESLAPHIELRALAETTAPIPNVVMTLDQLVSKVASD